jgi:hypothetical protein
VKILSKMQQVYQVRGPPQDLHASATLTEVERFLLVPPNVLRDLGALLHLDLEFVHLIVSPSGRVTPTDCTLAFVDFFWQARHDHGDGATMAS